MGTTQRRCLQVLSVAMIVTATTAAMAGPTPEQKCQKAKVLARAKWLGCRAGERAKGIIGQGANPSGKCDEAFAAKLVKAAAVAPCRFVENYDGSVGDLDTGLVWEKKDAFDLVADLSNPHDADNTYSYGEEVAKFIGALNGTAYFGVPSGSRFAGFSDWRIPNLTELLSIVDMSVTYSGSPCGSIPESPCIDPIFGPTIMCFDTIFAPCYYHSTTIDTVTSGFALDAVNFENGIIFIHPGNPMAVRAVRNMAE